MVRRLVIERLSEGSVPSSEEERKVDAPSLAAIRLAFGVGKGPSAPPDDKTFKPVYTVSIPVFSLGGLDSDGVYEFDAVSLLAGLQSRAQRRKWAVRLELEFAQTAEAVTAADLYIESPYVEDGPTLDTAGRNRAGTPTPGGGRTIVVATSLAHDRSDIEALGGKFTVRLSDADPQRSEPASVQSPAREIELDFTQYEFEG
jgi:hypothetical protein